MKLGLVKNNKLSKKLLVQIENEVKTKVKALALEIFGKTEYRLQADSQTIGRLYFIENWDGLPKMSKFLGYDAILALGAHL